MTSHVLPTLRFDRSGTSPATLGYRMPAEWEPHRATWLVWPHNRADWEVKMGAIDWVYAEIVRLLVDGERVAILFQDRRVERRASRVLERVGVDPGAVERYQIATNRSWIRDSGPIFVTRQPRHGPSEVAVTDWHFNGWARYRAWQRDDRVPRRIARLLRMRRFEVRHSWGRGFRPFVLEGGSLDVNGAGLALTTEECLLSRVQARNPGVSRQHIEHILREALGIRRILWMGRGIAGDDTHGHVDDIARFVSASAMVVAIEHNRADINYAALADNRARAQRMTDLRGRPLRIVSLPMPRPLFFEGQRLPASYLNFYIGNRRVLVPTFNDPNDRVALSRLARLFPGRQVVGIHAVDLVLGFGTLHCLTQQEPALSGQR